MSVPVAEEGEVLLFNKPYKWTSFDVVRKVKRHVKMKKVGHAGTLDPLATGLLIVCTGRKTKTIDSIQAQEKEYTGTIFIGATTPSFDLETEVDQTFDISGITRAQVDEAVLKLTGEITQIPPMHSAVKLNGQRAYKIARRGETVELRSRQVTIKSFEITSFDLPTIGFRIACSKGTYIRSIARDLGELLHSGGHLTSLCRTKIGEYRVENALTMDDLESQYPVPQRDKAIEKGQSIDNK
jgi:tRNA pseudouridine55 synthase